MTHSVFRAVLLTVLACVHTELLGAQSTYPPVSAKKNGDLVTIAVEWNLVTKDNATTRITSPRINTRTPLTLQVNNFNFLRYKLQIDVEEEVIESYQVLDKLWSQLFSLGGIVALGTARADEKSVLAWRKRLSESDQELTAFLSKFTTVGLTDSQVADVKTQVGELGVSRIQELDRLRSSALATVASNEQMDAFDRAEAIHLRVVDRLNAFVSAARLTTDGMTRILKKSASGTDVTLTLTAQDQNKAVAGTPVSIAYFVQSKLPVEFHAGLGYTGIRQAEFEKVRSLSGQDLFAKVKETDGEPGLSVFLSYPVQAWGEQNDLALLVSLGTQVSDPTKALSVGGSIRLFSRVFLTAGVASDEIAEQGNKVLDAIGGQTGTRELFDAISKRRRWGGFGAISFSVNR